MRVRIWSPTKAGRRALYAALLAIFALVLAGGSVLAAAIQDDGNLFSSSARATAETKIAQIQKDTNKTIAVKTVPNLGGKDIDTVADQYAQQVNLNGVLIYAAKSEAKLTIKVGVSTRPAVTTAEETAIRDQMLSQFKAGKFDDGLLGAIDRIGNDLRAATPVRTGQTQPVTAPVTSTQKSGVSGFVILLVVLVVIALIVLLVTVFRRNRTPSVPSGGYSQNYGPQGGGYGPGYGPGYGQPGGGGGNVGGSILGGAAGGIGGAIIGNAIYDHFRDRDGNRVDGGGNYGGNYGGNTEPGLADDHGRVDDSPVDSGSWGGGSDPGAGDWGGGGSDPGAGDWGGGSSDSSSGN